MPSPEQGVERFKFTTRPDGEAASTGGGTMRRRRASVVLLNPEPSFGVWAITRLLPLLVGAVAAETFLFS
jgi:hypothetical protein